MMRIISLYILVSFSSRSTSFSFMVNSLFPLNSTHTFHITLHHKIQYFYRDTIHIEGVKLGFDRPVFFDRHAVGGEYGAGWKSVGAGRLVTTFFGDVSTAYFSLNVQMIARNKNIRLFECCVWPQTQCSTSVFSLAQLRISSVCILLSPLISACCSL